MNTDSKKITIFDMVKTLGSMFNSEPDIEEYDVNVLSGELKEKLIELKKKETSVEKGFNNSSKPSNKGGFANKIDPQDAINRINNAKARQEAVKKIHEQISDKDEQERA